MFLCLRIPALLFASCLAASAGTRVVNTTITLPDAPPVSTIELENAFPGLGFSAPVCLRSPAGDARRLFVCEKGGDLELVPDVTDPSPTKSVFLNVDGILAARGEAIRTTSEMGLLSVAFHPNYATNGFFFTVYNVTLGGQGYQRLSRWHDPDITDAVADPGSETVLIEMLDQAGNHNGGDLHFGPDGYLYMSWGDEGNQNDSLNNSQFIDKDFWSSVTRIDVDLEPEDYTAADGTGGDDANLRPNAHPAVVLAGGNPHYEVPADNPWVDVTDFNGVSVVPTDVRTEFYAVGFRNPWRFSFDSLTGELWVGDVGQGAWEEVAVVERGSNHGWAWFEGDANGPKFNDLINNASRANATLTAPAWDYGHGSGAFQGNSVTGGFVYRGENIPELVGKYIFADYTSGNIWSLERTDRPGEPEVVRIAGSGGLVGFAPDPSNGDVLIADIGSGQIHRLVARDVGGSFPATLSGTGIFSDVATLTPNPGVVPYAVNLPFWSDHGVKQRWFAMRDDADVITYSRDGAWQFPDGMVWAKHFDLELERGNPASRKRIETRVLVRNQIGETTDSVLVSRTASGRVFVPTDDSIEGSWDEVGFDDSAWAMASTGIGYDDNSDYLPLFGPGGNLGAALDGENTSVYLRIPFEVTGADAITELTLRMMYDDGFVAYLNGQQVAAANAPGTVTWNAGASGDHPDAQATSFEDFDLNAFAPLLREGTNVLAIQGLNNGIGSSDMLIRPELIGGTVSFTEGVYGVSYRWNEAGTAADLVGSGGEEIELTVTTSSGPRQQTWSIPSRAACTICHTADGGLALSFNTRQLNHDGNLGGMAGNFLTLLRDSGYLDSLPEPPASLPRHVVPSATDYSLEARVRSYLDVNCAYCHQDPGIQPLSWEGNHHLSIAATGIINGVALAGTQHPDDRLVVPGSPDRSVILNRVAVANGYTRMPPLATNELDAEAIQLLTDWINQEASELVDYAAWRLANFGSTTSPDGAPDLDADGDGQTNNEEWIALTDPRDAESRLATELSRGASSIEIVLPGRSNRGATVEHSSNLLDWFRWNVPGNDGIPRNPAGVHSVTGAASEPGEYFRVRIGER